ncbi:MAG: MnhB domain-containing protein [Planctomycetota bacterium]|jgi:multicomponent Na+:H+ antiporter subunit B
MEEEKQNLDREQPTQAPEEAKGMTIIVKTVSSWVKVLIFVFGIYIILFGHLTPGGGFAGGVILAASYVLLMLAFGREFAEENLPKAYASKLDCIGAFAFGMIAVLGFAFGGAFFANFLVDKYGEPLNLLSAGTIPLSNIAIGIKVGASLFLVILSLSICCKGKECKFD